MRVLPVIGRELRSAVRQSSTYHLRVLGVLTALAAVTLLGLSGGIRLNAGPQLFVYLHRTLFFSIWILVPLLTADGISRERREGTLPLLFLTPLGPLDIVYAKGFAHALRAFSLWLAVLPVLTICFLVGGVAWTDVALSVLINFGALCLATAAGLTASALSRSWSRANLVAVGIAFVFLLLSLAFLYSPLHFCVGLFNGSWSNWSTTDYWEAWTPGEGLGLALNSNDQWQEFGSQIQVLTGAGFYSRAFSSNRGGYGSFITPLFNRKALLADFGVCALGNLLWLLLMLRFCAWRVKKSWQESPPSARMARLEKTLFRPVLFQGTLRRWLRWQLRRNPIGWLEQRNWSGRLVVWSWFAVVVCVYSSLLTNLPLYQHGFYYWQELLALLLLGSMALSAAGSFRRERESGVLELLLVAPLRESQIIIGRLRGLWGQFLPAILLMCAIWLYGATFLPGESQLGPIFEFIVTCVTIPVVGLYFSLSRANTMAAFLWTVGIILVAPAAMANLIGFWAGGFGALINPGTALALQSLVPAAFQVALAQLFGWRLYADLKGRRFALG